MSGPGHQEKEHELKHPRTYYLRWLLSQYRDKALLIGVLLVLTVLTTLVSVLYPIFFKNIIDSLTSNMRLFRDGKLSADLFFAERDRLLLLLLLLGVGNWFTGFYPFLRGRTNLVFEMMFREGYFARILEKRHTFFLKFRTGDLVTRLTEDVKNFPPGISWLCCSGIFRAFNSTCIIFFCLLSMFSLNVKLTLLAILPLPVLVFLFWKLESSVEARFKRLQQGISTINDFLESAYSGIKILKTFNAEPHQERMFRGQMDRRIGLETDVIKIEGLFMVYFEFLNHIGQLLVLLFGGLMVIRGQLSIGEYYAFFAYLGMIVFPLIDIPMLLVTLVQSFVTIDRLEEVGEYEKDLPAKAAGTQTVDELLTLEFDRVCFSYLEPRSPAIETETPAPDAAGPDAPASPTNEGKPFGLRDFSFVLRKGEKLAVVGKIGSGKTTLLNCVAGILQADSGEIRVNGVPVQALAPDKWRSKIGFIQQEPVVFSETVAANIDFWRGCSRDWIENCARISQLDGEIRAFPHQYDEKIGQRGITMSGGQRQRLSVARALAGKPCLVLMDDITSSLDAENEQKLWKDLGTFAQGLTCMIVTHRLASAQYADRIMVLDNGRIEAVDTHQNLLRTSPTYQELANQ